MSSSKLLEKCFWEGEGQIVQSKCLGDHLWGGEFFAGRNVHGELPRANCLHKFLVYRYLLLELLHSKLR